MLQVCSFSKMLEDMSKFWKISVKTNSRLFCIIQLLFSKYFILSNDW